MELLIGVVLGFGAAVSFIAMNRPYALEKFSEDDLIAAAVRRRADHYVAAGASETVAIDVEQRAREQARKRLLEVQ